MEIIEIGLLAIKAESTYGTDPVPTVAANLIPVQRDSLGYSVDSTAVSRKALDGTLAKQPGFNTLPNVTLRFRYELRGNRTTGAAPDISAGLSANKVEIDPILQAANLDPTYVAESSGGARDGMVVYRAKAHTNEGPSVTAYWWSALKLHKLLGGKVDLSFLWEAGQMVMMDVTIRGKYIVPADTTFPTAGLVWLQTKPPVFEGGVTLLEAWSTSVFRRAQFDLGNQIGVRADAQEATGVKGFIITGRDSKGSFNPESVAEATHPLWADWRSSKPKVFQCATPVAAGVSGNRIDLTNWIELKGVNYENQDGSRVHSAQFDMVSAATGPVGVLGGNLDWGLKFY